MAEHDDDNDWVDPRVMWERQRQLRRARAELALMIDSLGAHAAVVLFNGALREALDRLGEEPC